VPLDVTPNTENNVFKSVMSVVDISNENVTSFCLQSSQCVKSFIRAFASGHTDVTHPLKFLTR
jgi:hypothetical protein